VRQNSENFEFIPNEPKGLIPATNYHEASTLPFKSLASQRGVYNFYIPELKYDGIYSRKNGSWSLCENKKKTYASDNYFHVPKCLEKTIVDPPECSDDYF
jgi:hypothetical protein